MESYIENAKMRIPPGILFLSEPLVGSGQDSDPFFHFPYDCLAIGYPVLVGKAPTPYDVQ